MDSNTKREARAWAIFAIVILIMFGVVYVVTGQARAHHAPSGLWTYPPGCCNSAATHPTGDCAPIPEMSVRETPDGYAVTLAPGQHPKLKSKGYSGLIPYRSARPSPDGEYHICLSTDGARRYCFFSPPMAF